MIHWSFSSKSSKHYNLLTVIARDLTFKKKECSPPSIFHMSHVTCLMSNDTSDMSHVKKNYQELVGGGSVINEATPSSFFYFLIYLSYYSSIHGILLFSGLYFLFLCKTKNTRKFCIFLRKILTLDPKNWVFDCLGNFNQLKFSH